MAALVHVSVGWLLFFNFIFLFWTFLCVLQAQWMWWSGNGGTAPCPEGVVLLMARTRYQPLAWKQWWIQGITFVTSWIPYDINVIDQSDLFEELTRGTAPEVHFVLNNKVYDMEYYLTDGIYPEWYVLMQLFSNPVDNKHSYRKRNKSRLSSPLEFCRRVGEFWFLHASCGGRSP